MTYYAKLRVSGIGSESSDYSDPKVQTRLDDYTTSGTLEAATFYESAATTGTTIELGTFTTIKILIVKNKDTTNFVTATWTGGAANSQVIDAGGIMVLSGAVTVANDLVLTADTSACNVEVTVFGT